MLRAGLRAIALLAMATGLSGCFHGLGAMNMLSTALNLLMQPDETQATTNEGASTSAPATYVSNTTYVTNSYSSYGSSSAYRAPSGGSHRHRR